MLFKCILSIYAVVCVGPVSVLLLHSCLGPQLTVVHYEYLLNDHIHWLQFLNLQLQVSLSEMLRTIFTHCDTTYLLPFGLQVVMSDGATSYFWCTSSRVCHHTGSRLATSLLPFGLQVATSDDNTKWPYTNWPFRCQQLWCQQLFNVRITLFLLELQILYLRNWPILIGVQV